MDNLPLSSLKSNLNQHDSFRSYSETTDIGSFKSDSLSSFIQTFASRNDENLNSGLFFQELIYWAKKSLNSASPEVFQLLEICQWSIQSDLLIREKFGEITNLLVSTLKDPTFLTTIQDGQSLILQTLVIFAEKLNLSNNPEKLQNEIEESTCEIAQWLKSQNSFKLTADFLAILHKAIIASPIEKFPKIIFSLKCSKQLVLIIEELCTSFPKAQENSQCLDILEKILENFTGNLECIVSSIFLSSFSQKFPLEFTRIIEVLIARAQKSRNSETSQSCRKLLIKIILNPQVPQSSAKETFEKLQKLDWSKEIFPEPFTSSIKKLILESDELKNKSFVLDIIFPWFSDGFCIPEIKLAAKICSDFPETTSKFLSHMLETAKSKAGCKSHFKVSKDKPIVIEFDFNILHHREFSIWTKFLPDNCQSSIFEVIQINKFISLLLIIEKSSFKVELIKSKEKLILVSIPTNFVEMSWYLIGLSFNYKQKINNKYPIIVDINNIHYELLSDEISNFKSINSLEINGSGRLEFLYIYTGLVNKSMLLGHKPQDQDLIEAKKSEFLKLNCRFKEPECQVPFKHIIKSPLTQGIGLFQSLKAVGSIKVILPILSKSNDSKIFELFFKIITEFCEWPEFDLIIDDVTFPLLKYILAEKSNLINLDWLEAIEGFLLAFRKFPKYPKAVDNLYFNIKLWGKITTDYVIYYLEAVKTHVSSLEYPVSESSLNEIIEYFRDFAEVVENKRLVLSYLLQIVAVLLRKVPRGSKLRAFYEILNVLVDAEIFGVVNCEEICKFFNELSMQEWSDCLGLFIQIAEMLNIFVEKFPINAVWRFVNLCLVLSKNYWVWAVKQAKESFIIQIDQFFDILNRVVGKRINLQLVVIIMDFVSKPKINSTGLAAAINAVTLNLVQMAENVDEFKENLNTLNSYLENFEDIRENISKQQFFPSWLISLLQLNHLHSPELQTLIIHTLCTTSSENYDKSRIVLFELIKLDKVFLVFQVLKGIFINLLKNINSSKTKKYLIEFFNLAEDVVQRISYDKIDCDLITDFVRSCIIPLKTFNFSTGFCNFSGFISYSFFEKVKKDDTAKSIVLREGGLARQFIYFIFYALSYKPNPEFEDFLKKFSVQEKNKSYSRAEWEGLDADPGVKVSNLASKPKQKSCKNLISIFIFIEWAEIIRIYFERGVKIEEIRNSIRNFSDFIKESKLDKKLKDECKDLNKQSFKDFNKICLDHLHNLNFHFLPESSRRFEVMQKFLYLSSSINSNSEGKSIKHETFKQDLKAYLSSLSEHIKQSQLSEFLNQSQKVPEIEYYLKVLTTLKVLKTFTFYFTETPFFPPVLPHKSTSLSKASTKEYKKQRSLKPGTELSYEKLFNKILQTHCQFYGNLNNFSSPQGKIYIRSTADRLGRRLGTKIKVKHEAVRIRSVCREDMMSSLDVSKTLEYEAQECEETEESNPSDDLNQNQNIEDFEEAYLSSAETQGAEFECEIIYIKGSLYGTLNFYQDSLVFTSKSSEKPAMDPVVLYEGKYVLCSSALPETQIKKKVMKVWNCNMLAEVVFKKFIHNICAIEIYLKSGKSYLLNFFTKQKLKEVYSSMKSNFLGKGLVFLSKRNLYQSRDMWVSGKITNFEYLMILNKLSSRSFNNLSQYPVFPWILKDFESEVLDLKSEKTFRNFSFPVSAQTAESREKIKRSLEFAKQDTDHIYNFGTHYSAGGIILHYLLRIQPFTTESLNLHRGSFDLADRLFLSLSKSFQSTQISSSDTKELIPELFYLPEMFCNLNQEPLGTRQKGCRVNDVKLPRWANNNVYLFIMKHRKALESEYVSRNLHHWIDLIFGSKQKGKKAEEACNLFHPITYADIYEKLVIDAKDIFQKGYYCQAVHYGQVPEQIFVKPHPARRNCEVKLNVCEKILANLGFECIKKYFSQEFFIVLSSSKYLIVVHSTDRVYCTCFRWLAGNGFDLTREKKSELKGVFACRGLMAVVYEDKWIVTAGYVDLSLAMHDFAGGLVRVFYFHSMETSDLQGGKWVISASVDSTLLVWTEESTTLLHGHIAPITSVTGIYDLYQIASCSEFILLHDSRSGEILHKINEKSSKILSSPSGFYFAQVGKELKHFYLNSNFIKSYEISHNKLFSIANDCIIKEDRGSISISPALEDQLERSIVLQETLDLISIIYIAERDTLMFINHTNYQYILYSVEIKSKEANELWL